MNQKISLLTKHIVIFLLSFISNISLMAQSEKDFDSILFNKIILYSAKDFDSWLITRLQNRQSIPVFEGSLVLKRIELDKFTTDNAILSVVNSYIEADRETLRKKYLATNLKLFSSMNYIDNLLKIIYERPFLESQLIKKKVEIINNNIGVGYEYSPDEYEKVILLTDSLRIESIITKLIVCNELADHYIKNKQFEIAENFYATVLAYPFFKEKSNNVKKMFYTQYIEAGKGLLWLRRDSLLLLERTFFAIPARSTLDPIRDEMIMSLKK